MKITAFGIIIVALLLCLNFAHAETQVGINVGQWMKYELAVSGNAPPSDMPSWVKAECTSISGTTVSFSMTMHMSDGTEQMTMWTIDVASGSGNASFQIIIPANSITGDTIQLVTNDSVTIAGEAVGTYAGASRTYVYATQTAEDRQITYRWDKQTGILLEVSLTQGSTSLAYKATNTNIWQASSSNPFSMPSLPIEILSIGVSVAMAMAIVAIAVIYTKHKRGKN
ncbi:MAG: hypothetical protein H5T41_00665 [Methanomassiliicoccales archaeon]|nr:hypothetical protein [Methanomassiliicoccales archaeon]